MKILVIGMGQTLRGDDAAGSEAVRRWQADYPATASRAEVTVEFSELPGLALLDLLDGYDAGILVDAVQTTAAAGTIFRLGLAELESFDTAAKSAHGWGVAESLELDQQLNRSRPPRLVRIVGIQAQQLELGHKLSTAVENAMPAAADAIEKEIQAFLRPTP